MWLMWKREKLSLMAQKKKLLNMFMCVEYEQK